jgi:hypothetical protein
LFLYILDRPRSYYFRIKVPLDLRPRIGRTFIVRSLGTRDMRQARYLASGLGLALYSSFEKMRLSERTPMVDIDKLLQQMDEGRTRDFGVDKVVFMPDGQVVVEGLKVDGAADTANFNSFVQAKRVVISGQSSSVETTQSVETTPPVQSKKYYSEFLEFYLLSIDDKTA